MSQEKMVEFFKEREWNKNKQPLTRKDFLQGEIYKRNMKERNLKNEKKI